MEDERKGLPSASTMERTYYCPGSLKAAADAIAASSAAAKSPTADPATYSGLVIHKALEERDYSALGMDEKEVALRIKAMEQEILKQWKAEKGITGDIDVRREERYWINDSGGDIASAKPDVVFLSGSQALVINYKTGYKESTPAHVSWQSATEGVSVWMNFRDVQRVRVAVAQYRLKGFKTQADYSDDDLDRLRNRIVDNYIRAEDPDAPRAAGPWCDWCPAKAFCRQAVAYSMIPASIAGETLTIEGCVALYHRRGTINKVLDATIDRLKQADPAELAKFGLAVGPGRKMITIKDAPGLAKLLRDYKFMTDDQFLSHGRFSYPQIRAYLMERFCQSMEINDAANITDTILSEFCEEKESEKMLKTAK